MKFTFRFILILRSCLSKRFERLERFDYLNDLYLYPAFNCFMNQSAM